MIAHAIFFYIFSIIAIVSAIMVTASKNTVHSVFFLILDFISISCLFIMIGAEFLGMIMLIVYVGAVAVLFLFVVMLMNVTEQKLSWFRGTKKSGHIPTGLIVGSVILLELVVIAGGWKYRNTFSETKFLSFENVKEENGFTFFTIENEQAVAEINSCGGHNPENLETGEMISSEKIYI